MDDLLIAILAMVEVVDPGRVNCADAVAAAATVDRVDFVVDRIDQIDARSAVDRVLARPAGDDAHAVGGDGLQRAMLIVAQ